MADVADAKVGAKLTAARSPSPTAASDAAGAVQPNATAEPSMPGEPRVLARAKPAGASWILAGREKVVSTGANDQADSGRGRGGASRGGRAADRVGKGTMAARILEFREQSREDEAAFKAARARHEADLRWREAKEDTTFAELETATIDCSRNAVTAEKEEEPGGDGPRKPPQPSAEGGVKSESKKPSLLDKLVF